MQDEGGQEGQGLVWAEGFYFKEGKIMNCMVRMFFVLVLSVFLGGGGPATAEDESPDLRAWCEEAGFMKAGKESTEFEKPSHEEQYAFVKAHPQCPPYDWWELTQEVFLQTVEAEVAMVRLDTMHRTFPEGTRVPRLQIDLCARCAEAHKVQTLLAEIDHEACGFPVSPDITKFCARCPK